MNLQRRHIILPSGVNAGGDDIQFITLQHPATGMPAQFLIQEPHVYELRSVNIKHGCWFSGNTVASDGSLYCALESSALYIFLGCLLRETNSAVCKQYRDIREILYCASCPSQAIRLSKLLSETELGLLTDVQEHAGDVVCRLNEEKVKAWADCRYAHFQETVKAELKGLVNEKEVDGLALALMAEFMPPEIVALAVGTDTEATATDTFAEAATQEESAAIISAEGPLDDYSKLDSVPTEMKRMQTKSRLAQQLAKGPKQKTKLTAFFAKK
eukprot:Clim_evm18s200 gene=Clim_evmTU18s200